MQETSTCHYVINATSPLACGCERSCELFGVQLRVCGQDGCGGYCSPADLAGECPYTSKGSQICDYDSGLCCQPDCNNRDCGDDGCGNSCGTCGVGEVCAAYQVCLQTPNYPPQFAITYQSDGTSLACAWLEGGGGRGGGGGSFCRRALSPPVCLFPPSPLSHFMHPPPPPTPTAVSFFGGIISAVAVAGSFIFWFRGGREAFDKWRFSQGGVGAGLMKGPVSAAAAPSLSSSAGGGYGSTVSSSGGGGYGT